MVHVRSPLLLSDALYRRDQLEPDRERTSLGVSSPVVGTKSDGTEALEATPSVLLPSRNGIATGFSIHLSRSSPISPQHLVRLGRASEVGLGRLAQFQSGEHDPVQDG